MSTLIRYNSEDIVIDTKRISELKIGKDKTNEVEKKLLKQNYLTILVPLYTLYKTLLCFFGSSMCM